MLVLSNVWMCIYFGFLMCLFEKMWALNVCLILCVVYVDLVFVCVCVGFVMYVCACWGFVMCGCVCFLCVF